MWNLKLLEEIFDVGFHFTQRGDIESDPISKQLYIRGMTAFPFELWNDIEYLNMGIFIYSENMRYITDFLNDDKFVINFTPYDLHVVSQNFDTIFSLVDGGIYPTSTKGNYLIFDTQNFNEEKDEDRLHKLIPNLNEPVFFNEVNELLIPLKSIKQLANWFEDPFPLPQLPLELAYFKLFSYIKSFDSSFSAERVNFTKLVFDNIDDPILEAISEPYGPQHRIINDITNAYSTAYQLYHEYRAILRSVIPEIADLGVLDY